MNLNTCRKIQPEADSNACTVSVEVEAANTSVLVTLIPDSREGKGNSYLGTDGWMRATGSDRCDGHQDFTPHLRPRVHGCACRRVNQTLAGIPHHQHVTLLHSA